MLSKDCWRLCQCFHKARRNESLHQLVVATDSKQKLPTAPNLSARDFSPASPDLIFYSGMGTDLKPVVDAGLTASKAVAAMQGALMAVRKDVALLHSGAQDSPHAVLGLPRAVDELMRSTEQEPQIRKAIKAMVIHREDGILILEKTLGDLEGIEVRVISQIAEHKRVSHSSMNLQVIDFACDFDQMKSGGKTGGHYRKGYTREAVATLLRLFADTSGA